MHFITVFTFLIFLVKVNDFNTGKIPDDARVELEWFMKYIVKKYGLAKNRGLF